MGQRHGSRTLPIHELPIGVLLKIFSYLTIPERLQALRVCKRWNDLLRHPSVWKHIDLSQLQVQPLLPLHSQVNTALQVLRAYAGQGTKQVCLQRFVTNDILKCLQKCCPNLESITLYVPSSKVDLSLLSRNLKVIDLRLPKFNQIGSSIGCLINDFAEEPFFYLKCLLLLGAEITNEFCLQLSLSKHLYSLTLYECVFTTAADDLDVLTKELTGLRNIDIAFCWFPSIEELEVVLRSVSLNLMNRVTTFGFHDPWIFGVNPQPAVCLKFDQFLKLLNSSNTLVNLHLSGISGITPKVFCEFAKHHLNIESLHLTSCSEVSNETVTIVANNLRHLKELKLRGCRDITNGGLQSLAHHPNLKKLDLSRISNLAEETIVVTVQSIPRITHLVLSLGHGYRGCIDELKNLKPQLVISFTS